MVASGRSGRDLEAAGVTRAGSIPAPGTPDLVRKKASSGGSDEAVTHADSQTLPLTTKKETKNATRHQEETNGKPPAVGAPLRNE